MDKLIKKIIKKLNDSGYDAYIVGGYVRDKLLNIESDDIDICTNALPKDVINILNLNKNSSIKYGSINIKTKKYNIDITSFRKEDNYLKHSPTDTIFVNDIKTDLKRRDFTCNTLLMNKEGQIIDYYNGIKDINNRIIKCVGNVKKKLNEDPLRILRAIRLSIVYDFKIDDEILDFITHNKELINEISYFRKKEELDKILTSDNYLKGLEFIKKLDLYDSLGIRYDNVTYTRDLIGLYVQINLSEKYPLTKNEKNSIKEIKEILDNKKVDNYMLYKYGLYENKIAGEILGIDYKIINKRYNSLPIKSRKDIKITPKTIAKLNNNCYNNINNVYVSLEKNILDGNIKNNSRDIIKFLRKECNNEQ